VTDNAEMPADVPCQGTWKPGVPPAGDTMEMSARPQDASADTQDPAALGGLRLPMAVEGIGMALNHLANVERLLMAAKTPLCRNLARSVRNARNRVDRANEEVHRALADEIKKITGRRASDSTRLRKENPCSR